MWIRKDLPRLVFTEGFVVYSIDFGDKEWSKSYIDFFSSFFL